MIYGNQQTLQSQYTEYIRYRDDLIPIHVCIIYEIIYHFKRTFAVCTNNDSTILADSPLTSVIYLLKWLVYILCSAQIRRGSSSTILYILNAPQLIVMIKKWGTFFFTKYFFNINYFIILISQDYIANEMFKFNMMDYTTYYYYDYAEIQLIWKRI